MSQDVMPPAVQDTVILKKKVWKRIHRKNQNFVGFLTGDVGSAKSGSTASIAQAVDPDFGIDDVCFTPEAVMDKASDFENYDKGRFIVFEEGGVNADAKDFWDDVNRALDYVLQTWREQNRGLLINLPSMDLIDKRLRKRGHAFMEMDGKLDGEYAYVKYMNIIEDKWTGDLYRKYPELRDPSDGLVKKFKRMRVAAPPESFWNKYEPKQRKFKRELAERLAEEIKDGASDGDSMSNEDIAQEVVNDASKLENYMQQNGKQIYLDRDLLYSDYADEGISDKDTRRIKKKIYQVKGWHDRDNYQ